MAKLDISRSMNSILAARLSLITQRLGVLND